MSGTGEVGQGTRRSRARRVQRGRRGARYGTHVPYPFEYRLRAVKLFLEEGYGRSAICEELRVSKESLRRWVELYQAHGEAGLQPQRQPVRRRQLPVAVKQAITRMKREQPTFGVKRIAQVLRRTLLLSASPETVRQTLHAEGLIEPRPKRQVRSPKGPRFFERATPNQLWQSDIFTFHLRGKAAYLIGFMDDYSRYLVGLELFRSQTAEAVLEVYRRAVGEYGPPKELLTDQGRQYTNWRGTTRFEAELKKDQVKHLKSRPHHPMTLGKLERFWRTIFSEFLCRVQLSSFEEARERIALWLKYYHHRRPHQSLGGLCPAERFFEVQHEVKRTLEQGIAENVLELALRGQPQRPFYLVGQLGEQSVVIKGEQGQVKLLLDGEQAAAPQELVYALGKGADNERANEGASGAASVDAGGEGAGGAGPLERAAAAGGAQPGAGGEVDGAAALAGAGGDGYASHLRGPGAEGARGAVEPGTLPAPGPAGGPAPGSGGEAGGAVSQAADGNAAGSQAAGSEATSGQGPRAQAARGQAPSSEAVGGNAASGNAAGGHASGRRVDGEAAGARATGPGPLAGGGDPRGAGGAADGDGGGQAPGRLAQDLLPVGAARLSRFGYSADRSAGGPPSHPGGSGEEPTRATGPGVDHQGGGAQRDGEAAGAGPGPAGPGPAPGAPAGADKKKEPRYAAWWLSD
jgi:transposase InsO family protein